jgi:hypothetical protein
MARKDGLAIKLRDAPVDSKEVRYVRVQRQFRRAETPGLSDSRSLTWKQFATVLRGLFGGICSKRCASMFRCISTDDAPMGNRAITPT